MNPLKSALTRLLYAGSEELELDSEKRPVIVMNVLALLAAISVLGIGLYLYSLCGSRLLLISVCTESVLLMGIIVLNKMKKHFLANIATLVIHVFFAIFFSGLLGRAMPAELVTAFLLTFIIGASFLVYKQKMVRMICIFTAIALFIIITANNHWGLVKPIPMSLQTEATVRVTCWIGMLVLMMFVTWLIIQKNDQFILENKQLLRQVEQANIAKSIYLRETSHELRTPLGVVFSISQILQASVEEIKDPETAKAVNYLYAASLQGTQIINNVLDLSKLEAGKTDMPVYEPVILKQFVESCIFPHQYVARIREIEIEVDFQEQLPEAIVVEKVALTKIINNLCSNAVKFAGKKSVIQVQVYTQDRNLFFSVTNEGVISARRMQQLFRSFEAQRGVNSTGLGLVITKHLVEGLNGRISVKCAKGNTEFTFFIPLQISKAVVTDKGMGGAQRTALPLAGYKILLIDDNYISLQVLKLPLVSRGATILTAENGREGINLILTEKPDLVITDSVMPGIDGTALLRYLRGIAAYKDLPVIVVTGDTLEIDNEGLLINKIGTLLESGATDCLVKPYDFNDLEDLLLRHLPAREIPEVS
ncbi:ATP-binding response regulator [Chitinophaga nivalis]|uniref:histidine kinase n=1 Tax=Chitinophaga nivalis TaxID=2991709 RepID=A0ABT3II40_9BACT|nr:response regulator [Chitinophaga nivalis]MCW3466674.1 response regulator [Chitinophaga nivalis]MCW3483635.1 response regulator [Chitinophaga nivalis]